MSKYLIDLGAHKGQTVKAFYEGQLVEDIKDYVIYCFEPQEFKKDWDEVKLKYKNVCFLNVAAWTYDGELDLSINEQTVSSTHYKNQIKYSDDSVKKVKCIDFGKWIKQFQNDYVVLKMNIEGAEFELLNKMIMNDSIKCIDKLFIEWHDTKTNPPMTDERWKIEYMLKTLGIDFKSWRRSDCFVKDYSKLNP
jgi:FkbM family methyltransferase